MEEPEEIVIRKRQAAIKLAKNLEPFNVALGPEFDGIYVETLTEDIKQLAREIKKMARVIAVADGLTEGYLSVKVDDEEERVTKLLRRYSTRIQKMADLVYEVAYLDFEELEDLQLKEMMEVDEDDDEDD